MIALSVGGCSHDSANYSTSEAGFWIFSCPSEACGISGEGITPGEALNAFRSECERRAVEEIARKRAAGEKLTAREDQIFAYSVYGTGRGGCTC